MNGIYGWKSLSAARFAGLILSAALAMAYPGLGAARDVGKRAPGAFDYYVLALSWEPGFCATASGHNAECRSPKGFVLHGLWPQLEGGDYPSDCDGPALTAAQAQQWGPIYADPSLINHEWPKHGTCSGLSAQAYFQLSSADVAAVAIPPAYTPSTYLRKNDIPAITQAFLAANPGMVAGGFKVITRNGIVTEVDVCMTKAGVLRAC